MSSICHSNFKRDKIREKNLKYVSWLQDALVESWIIDEKDERININAIFTLGW